MDEGVSTGKHFSMNPADGTPKGKPRRLLLII
jgi:hypothetical protein